MTDKEIIGTSTLSKEGLTTIPKKVREHLKIQGGEILVYECDPEERRRAEHFKLVSAITIRSAAPPERGG